MLKCKGGAAEGKRSKNLMQCAICGAVRINLYQHLKKNGCEAFFKQKQRELWYNTLNGNGKPSKRRSTNKVQ